MDEMTERKIKLLCIIHHPFALWNAPDWLQPRLKSDFSQLDITVRDHYRTIAEDIAEAEIFLGWSLRGDQLRHARKLRWIHSTAAAVHQLMSPELIESEIVVTNARSVHGPVVAEHAIALIFAMAKRLPSCFRYQQQQHWAQTEIWKEQPAEVAGSTLLVVGLGSIGSEVARHGRGLGMHVIGVRRHPQRGAGEAHEVFGPSDLNEVVPRADFVVLAAPVTPHSEHIVGAAQLARMKPDAFLINVARGTLVDQGALLTTLKKNGIAGAALDVFEHEPLSADSEFWKLPNVLITPHTAGVTSQIWERQYQLIAENTRRYLAGRELLNVVNKRAGY